MKSILIILIIAFSLIGNNGFAQSKTGFTLYVFEGSDWCTNCIRLEKKVLSDSAFLKKIKGLNISVQRLDFPQRKTLPAGVKSYNNKMAEKYHFDGSFPTIILADPHKPAYRKIKFDNQSPSDFFILIQSNLKALQ